MPRPGETAGALANPARRRAALFGACCLFLSSIEYVIPKPLPFMRIGLANLPLLLALGFPLKEYGLLVAIKIIGQGLITGTLFSYVFLFSVSGSLASAALMYGLRRLFAGRLSLAGIGVAGAFVSNAAQLLLARFFIFGQSALYLAPPFLAAGIITGAALGIFAGAFAEKSEFLTLTACNDQVSQNHTAQLRVTPWLKIFAALAAAIVFSLIPSLPVKAALALLFAALALIAGKKIHPVMTVITIAAVVICNLFPPYGKVLFEAGPLSVTAGALAGGLTKAAQIEGLLFLSLAAIPRRLDLSGLPGPLGAFGSLLGETFAMLDRLNERKQSVAGRGTGVMKRLDDLLMEMSEE